MHEKPGGAGTGLGGGGSSDSSAGSDSERAASVDSSLSSRSSESSSGAVVKATFDPPVDGTVLTLGLPILVLVWLIVLIPLYAFKSDDAFSRHWIYSVVFNAAVLILPTMDIGLMMRNHWGFRSLSLSKFGGLLITTTVVATSIPIAIWGLYPFNYFVTVGCWMTFQLPCALFLIRDDSSVSWVGTIKFFVFNILGVSGVGVVSGFSGLYAVAHSVPILQAVIYPLLSALFFVIKKSYTFLMHGPFAPPHHAVILVQSEKTFHETLLTCFLALSAWPLISSRATFGVMFATDAVSSLLLLVTTTDLFRERSARLTGCLGKLLGPSAGVTDEEAAMHRVWDALSSVTGKLFGKIVFLIAAPPMRFWSWVSPHYLFRPDVLCDATFFACLIFAGASVALHSLELLLVLWVARRGHHGAFIFQRTRQLLRQHISIFVVVLGLGATTTLGFVVTHARMWVWALEQTNGVGGICIDTATTPPPPPPPST